jgi:hypothetical protein
LHSSPDDAIVVVVLFVYSFVVWRGDPEMQPPAGTQPANDE